MSVVQAPPARAPRIGLVASSPPPPDQERWEDHLAYRPEAYGPTEGVQTVGACTTGDMGDPAARVFGNVTYIPWFALVEDACTTMGGAGLTDDLARLRRWLEQATSYAVAREVWAGARTQADATGNAYLTKAGTAADPLTVVQAAAVKPARAFSALEQALADHLRGQTGMIHVPRALAPMLPGVDGTASDGVLRTKSGHLVVMDAGYPGPTGTTAAPASATPAGQANATAGQAWIFATSDVVVRLGEIFTVPDSDGQAVRTATNTRIARAYRPVAAPIEPGRFAALVDLTA